jgi:hypothetical protein
MPSQPITEQENQAINDLVRASRSWTRARGLDSDQPSRIDLRTFAHHLAQQAGEDCGLPLPGLGEEDYAGRILKALALRGFCRRRPGNP